MSNWVDRFRDGSGTGSGRQAAYNVELSFLLAEPDERNRSRRITLVAEALRSIQNRDGRMLRWQLLVGQDPEWVCIHAVVVANQPGEVAALGEAWMRSAIAAANLAVEPPVARVPAARSGGSLGWSRVALDSVTAQVSSVV